MGVFCQGAAVAVGLSHFLIFINFFYRLPFLFISFARFKSPSLPLYCFLSGGLLFAVLSPSLSVHLPFILQSLLPRFSPGLPLPACPSLSACMTAPLPTFFHSPSQISLCLSSSDNLPGGRWRGGGALAEPKSYWHLGEARQNHSENHLVKWFSFTTFCSLPHPSPHVCNSWSAGRAALNVVSESWQRRSKEIRPFARASLICSLFSAFLSVFID